jgi:hypothetical protein
VQAFKPAAALKQKRCNDKRAPIEVVDITATACERHLGPLSAELEARRRLVSETLLNSANSSPAAAAFATSALGREPVSAIKKMIRAVEGGNDARRALAVSPAAAKGLVEVWRCLE